MTTNTRKLGRTVAAAALAAAAVVGMAGSAGAAGPKRVIWHPECIRAEQTSEPWNLGSLNATYLCGRGFGVKMPVYELTDGTTHRFFVGSDHGVWTIWEDPEGHLAMAPLGGPVASDPRISDYSGNYIKLEVTGTDGNTWYKTRNANGSWSGWYR
ncbi:hypothetical protein [Kitasatospora sp. NPDC008115]|uniref:hypothetical protein n=1 Tax=Kitasatospora sp. NPDC008115 TaxID=3364022 RepID=UPI0036E5EEA6